MADSAGAKFLTPEAPGEAGAAGPGGPGYRVSRPGVAGYLVRATLLAIVYVLLARFGLKIHAVEEFATLVWPPTGVSLVAILTLGYRYWPSIAVGAVLANLWTGAPLLVALGIGVGNTLEAVLGAYALRRIPGFRSSLDRLQDVIGLVSLAAIASAMVSATIGVVSLLAGGIVTPDRFAGAWRAWWLGDAIGDLVVAPLLLTWRRPSDEGFRPPRLVEACALGATLTVASLCLFDLTTNGMASLLAPLLVWAAIRFEQRGAARAIFLVSVIAVWATARGHGPFVKGTIEESLFLLQSFMALTAGTFLVLGAVISERRRAEQQRQRAEEVIRESEERYRTLTEAVDQLMWISDAQGRMIFANRRLEESIGAPDLGRVGWAELIHPEDRRLLETLRGAIETGEPYRIECRVRMKNGSYRWMLARVVPLKDAQGAVKFWFGAAADVHDLKTAGEQLRLAKEEAEAANRAKDQFLATLSHELRTPLTPVLALSSALERNAEMPAALRKQIEIVRRNAELEARLIDDLLDLTRIARGKLQLELGPVNLGETLDNVLEVCREDAAGRGLLLERKGPAAGPTVRADPARLQQIFWNLVKNAIKFTPAGGRIVLQTVVPAPGRVAVEVADTGVGIALSEIGRIFGPFEQAGHQEGGLGLGLTISKALVEAQGGALTAHSEGLGLGATFSVELPALDDSEQAAAPIPVSSQRASSAGGRRILLVEDHADTLVAARELLTELACEVFAVASQQEAFEAAQKQSFDLVLSDLGLPDGSGLELMRGLRERYGLEGIAMTGYGMEEDVRQSREAGFVDHLVKPITFQRLANAIDRFFTGRPAADR